MLCWCVMVVHVHQRPLFYALAYIYSDGTNVLQDQRRMINVKCFKSA